MPLFKGGDASWDSWLSFDDPAKNGKTNEIAFYTGNDDISLIRTYARWLGAESIAVRGKEYVSLNTVVYSN